MSTDAPLVNPLSEKQQRVLGVLIEKAKTTQDSYPLTLNSLVTGCNQKSNRHPMMDLTEDDIDETIEELLALGLVERIQGGRVERWKHRCYEKWQINKVQMAILAELLLRGAQTEGELRGRAARMDPIESLEGLRENLKPLVERNFVVYLTPEGRRGTILTHGFFSEDELNQQRKQVADGGSVAATPRASPNEVAELRAEIAELRTEVQRLAELVHQLRGNRN